MAIYRIEQPDNDMCFRVRLQCEESRKLVEWLNYSGFFCDTTTITREDDEDIVEL